MRNFINIAEGIFLLFVALSTYWYFRGKKKLDNEEEIRRKIVVEKYKWLFYIVIIVSFFTGAGIIFNTIIG